MLNIYTSMMKEYANVTAHNSGKYNIESLLYFPSLFQKPNHLKNNKGANIIV